MAENIDAPKLVRGLRGINSRNLIWNSYRYELNKKRNSGYFWRCCRTDCRASLKTAVVDTQDLNTVVNIIGNQPVHTHGNDSSRLERMHVINQMKEKIVNNSTIPVKQAYDEVVTHHHQNAGEVGIPLPTIPDFNTVRSSLQRTKQQLCPPLPRDINEVHIPENYRETHLRERYLLHLNNVSGVAVFITDVELNILANSTTIYVDGTFKSAPHPYTQVFTIHAVHQERVILMATALLTGKTQAHYQEVFQCLHQEMTRIGNISIEEIICDFELAVFNAAREVFPNIDISGCYFHFSQNLWKHTQQVGLTVPYNNDPNVKIFFTYIYSLGFLPVGNVIECYNELLNNELTQYLIAQYPQMNEFVQYFNNTYVDGQNFPHQLWNVFERGMSSRTNNIVESYHARWNKVVGVRHPSIWTFLKKLQDQQALARNVVLNAENGNPPPLRRRKWRILEQRVVALKNDLLEGRKDIYEYWAAIRHNIQQFK